MTALQLLAASVFVSLALPAAGATTPAAAPTTKSAPQAPAQTRIAPFTQLGSDPVIELRGDGGAATIDFGARSDELVTRATLRLRYAYSPTLAPEVSHIRVSLNDEVVATLAVAAAGAGEPLTRSIELDPRLIVGANRLTFALAAREGAAAAVGAQPGLWAHVSGTSELELGLQPLAVADDLAILPEPFFDKRDKRRLTLPFVFAAQPSTATLRSAAVVASWFGQLARWRGARFPASLDAPVEGHAVVFATNAERPALIAAFAPAAGPELRVATNPADGRSKLLLVLGRDAADLSVAAEALVLGGAAMSGPMVKVKAVEPGAPRPAYDAPAMVKTNRPTKFAEALEWATQLEAAGRAPALPVVGIDLRAPPDLAAWRGPGVPITLKLQYNPTGCVVESQLEVSVNDELLQVMTLPTASQAITETRELHLPWYRLRGRMRLAFAFRFTPKADAACAAAPPLIRAAVSPESTIDFSGLPHYARMPNLNHFASVGYPFTKHADLSQTVVVLPEKPVAADIEAMLGLMGRMGEATQAPATRVRVATSREEAQLADADLLLVGATPQQALLVKWTAELPVALTGYAQRVSQPARKMPAVQEWLGLGEPRDTAIASQVSFEGGGPVAAVFGFESPVSSGRSVVAVTAVAPEQVLRVLEALEDGDQRRAMRGNAAFVMREGKVESVLVGRTYAVGFLPPWTGAQHWVMERPVAAGMLALFVLAVLGGLGLLVKTWLARRRGAKAAA
jgi:hypothetical protein